MSLLALEKFEEYVHLDKLIEIEHIFMIFDIIKLYESEGGRSI